MMLLSERDDAHNTHELGLLNLVVEEDDLAARAMDIARRVPDGPSDAIGSIKANLKHAAIASFNDPLDYETQLIVEAAETDEQREAVKAFVERRRPMLHTDRDESRAECDGRQAQTRSATHDCNNA